MTILNSFFEDYYFTFIFVDFGFKALEDSGHTKFQLAEFISKVWCHFSEGRGKKNLVLLFKLIKSTCEIVALFFILFNSLSEGVNS